jgi:methyltransferase (TIGR00027 family)
LSTRSQDASGPREGLRPTCFAFRSVVQLRLFQPAQRTTGTEGGRLPRLNLEFQRKRARALLKSVRAGDAEALRRFARWHPRASAPALHDAQLVVARESGFASWTRLREHIRSQAMQSPSSLAALLVAANRAVETERSVPLYRDPFARDLAGAVGLSLLAEMRQASWRGLASEPDPYLSILTRFFDDALTAQVRESAIRQIVIVGGGLDTRAFRLRWAADVTIFEIDQSHVLDYKARILNRLNARASCVRRTVRVDLRGSWSRALLKAGFDRDQKTAFLLERPQYLDARLVDDLVQRITKLSKTGSWLGMALIREQARTSYLLTPFLRKLEQLGLPPWQFGIDDPEAWLAKHGWETTSIMAGDPQASYGRWPYPYFPPKHFAATFAFLTQGWFTGKDTTWRPSR